MSCFPRHSGFAGRCFVSLVLTVQVFLPVRAIAQESDSQSIVAEVYTEWGLIAALIDDASDCVKDLRLPRGGILVLGVSRGSSAHEAGLRRGDLILSLGKPDDTTDKKRDAEVLRAGKTVTRTLSQKDLNVEDFDLVDDFAARAKPIEINVDSNGKGSYRTISAAICVAAPGDTIRVRDGLYRESVCLPCGVDLCAAADAAPVIVSQRPIRLLGGCRGNLVEGFTLTGEKVGLLVQSSEEIVVRKCSLNSPEFGLLSISVQGLTIEQCIAADCRTGAALKQTQAKLTDCYFDGNITALDAQDSNTIVTNATINGGNPQTDLGVSIDDGEISLEGSTIRNCSTAVLLTSADGKLTGNHVAQNANGVWIASGNVEVRSNLFQGQEANSLYAKTRDTRSTNPEPFPPAQVRIINNTFSASSGIAVGLSDAVAEVEHNLMEANLKGISVEGGTVAIVNNTIVLNDGRGIEITGKTQASVHNNIVAFNFGGLAVDSSARFESGFNNVHANLLTRSFPLIDGDYIRIDHLPLSTGERLVTTTFPADALRSNTDLNLDPGFVRRGQDHRLRSDSPLLTSRGLNGVLMGALPAVELSEETSVVSIANRLEFRDSGPATGQTYRPWSAGEKNAIVAAFEDAVRRAPGIMTRVTMYRPLRLYRVVDVIGRGVVLASAEGTTNGMFINDPCFAANRDYQSVVNTFIHECVHLIDADLELESSDAWSGLMRDRLEMVRREVKLGGGSFFERELTREEIAFEEQRFGEIARRHGLPQLYSAVNLTEALATCAERSGDYDQPQEIRVLLEQNLFSDPGEPVEWKRLVHEALENKANREFEKADQILTSAITASPQRHHLLLLRAQIRSEWAIEAARQRQKYDPQGMVQDYQTCFDALSDLPYSRVTYLCLDPLARYYRDQNDFDRALEYAGRNIELAYKPHLGFYTRSGIWSAAGRLEEAVQDATMAIERAPEDMTYLKWRADLFVRARDFEKAAADYARVIVLQPDDRSSYFTHAELAQALGQHEKAISDFDYLLSKQSVDPQTRLARGRSNMALGRFSEAAEDFAAGLKLFPRPVPDLLKLRLEALIKNGNPQDALNEINVHVERSQGFPVWRVIRGDVYRWSGDFAAAKQEFDAVIAELPEAADARIARGWLLATCPDETIRNPSQAVADADKAIELMGQKHWQACLIRATAAAAEGDFDQAVSFATISARTSPMTEYHQVKTLLSAFERQMAWIEDEPSAGTKQP